MQQTNMNKYPAPAKINTHLLVEGLNAKGMHLLHTGFIYVDLSDQLYIKPAEHIIVSCSNEAFSGEKNLVFKVLEALRSKHGILQGLHVHIEKHIPDQAGLGGGSSDAATALMVANQLWNLQISMQDMITFATPFGADIPCFLFSQASFARNVGDHLQKNPWIDKEPRLTNGFVCLSRPKHGLSTRSVFEHFDAIHALTQESGADTMRADSLRDAFIGLDLRPEKYSLAYPYLGQNALEASAATLLPELNALLDELKASGLPAWMSGSGSTCVALCTTQEEASVLARTLTAKHLADWTYVGKLLTKHPMQGEENWDVAKR